MHLRLRAFASSGWLPASLLAIATAFVLHKYGVGAAQIAIFGAYVIFGLAVPGMLLLRLLRGWPAHIAEDLALGLVVGYCAEIATYVVARAVGLPMLFLLWPTSTLFLFSAVPALRHHWRGSGIRAPIAWSWSIAAILGFLLFYSVGTVFVSHHLSGADTPYLDMPYHLALIGELRNHVPPQVPFVPNVPLAYHWFYYAEAAAASWATGIEPVTLLYRLSGLPMFVSFVILTAAAARRLTDRWWSGPVAVAVALFGTVASPYRWTAGPVFDSQTLWATWISPTNLFGLVVLAAVILALFDLMQTDAGVPRRFWLVVVALFVVAAGAKASILPVLIVGLLVVVAGLAIGRRLQRNAVASLLLAGIVLILAAVLLYRGATFDLVIGPGALNYFSVVGLRGVAGVDGTTTAIMEIVGLLVAIVLWSFLWAGAYGVLAQRGESLRDPRILLLVGICAGGLGALIIFAYPALNQVYYMRGAAGAFGLLTAAGLARVLPARSRYLPLIACIAVAALVGAAAVGAIGAIGPASGPDLATSPLSAVLPGIILPIVALIGVGAAAFVVLRLAARKLSVLQGAVPLLVMAVVMGFSIPNVVTLVRSPVDRAPISGPAVPADGITAARWLRAHSDPDDLVATNLHCRSPLAKSCDPRQFWVSAYSERHILVEGWAYTGKTIGLYAPFWDPSLLAANDAAFTDPSAAAVAKLRDGYGVRWLFADLTRADADSIGRYADMRYRDGDFAVYELRRP